MAQLVEYVDELVQEVGPRPAGTLQEHQAAELIAARLDGFGMPVDIEEFSCARNLGWVRALYYALSVAGAGIVSFTPIPAFGFILIVIGVVLMLLDYLGRNPLFSLFNNSLSQNVIARYYPSGAEQISHTRRVVILANYDSPRTMVQAAPPLVAHYSLLRRIVRITMGALVALSFLMLIPFPEAFKNIVAIFMALAVIIILLALLAELVNFFMPYNQGVNCNGSGIGVLYGLAQILSSGMDIASYRNASQQARKRQSFQGETGGRSSRADRADRAARTARGPRGAQAERAPQEAQTGRGPGMGRAMNIPVVGGETAEQPQGLPRRQEPRPIPLVEQETTSAKQSTQDLAQPMQTDPSSNEEGPRHSSILSHRLPRESSTLSVGDQLVNPFITQRPPLAEIEEANRQREEEMARQLEEQRLEEQRRQLVEESSRPEGEVPSWFLDAKKKAEDAKKKAEKKVEQRKGGEDDAGVVRSRFADVPFTSRGALTADEGVLNAVRGVFAAEGMLGEAEGELSGASSASGAEGMLVGAEGMLVGVEGEPGGASIVPATDMSGEPRFKHGYAHVSQETEREGQSGQDGQSGLDTQSRLDNQGGITSTPKHAYEQETETDSASVSFENREAVPLTAKPDLSGLDKSAFGILPGDMGRAGSRGARVFASAERSYPAATPDALPPEEADRGQRGDDQKPSFVLNRQRDRLRNRLLDLPSVSKESSGHIHVQQATLNEAPVAREELFSSENSLISPTGSFVPLGTTGIMKPLGEELLGYYDIDEIYIPDADDTSISEAYSQTGEYFEPELVNMPDSRVRSIFGSLGNRSSGKKKEKFDNAPSTWLGVDNRYDARKEGRTIGGWDNFGADDGWRGGAYGGKTYRANARAMMQLSRELLDKEVWLVALGASESRSAGLMSLFDNHASELKNALFINIRGVGTGDLVFTISEGDYRPAQTDPRMQSLIASAAQSMAIPIAPVDFDVFSTDATAALQEGARAISIMGLGTKVPVGWRWYDDDVSRLREENLMDAIALVIETVKNI